MAQSSYNLRLLYYIKFMIGVGQVSVPADGNAEYRVRDVKNIINYCGPKESSAALRALFLFLINILYLLVNIIIMNYLDKVLLF